VFPVVRVVRESMKGKPGCLTALLKSEGGEVWDGKFTSPDTCKRGSDTWRLLAGQFEEAAKNPRGKFIWKSSDGKLKSTHRAGGIQTFVKILALPFEAGVFQSEAIVAAVEFGAQCGRK